MIRAFNFVWILSIIGFLVGFLLAYAYMPKTVLFFVSSGGEEIFYTKDVVFYGGILIFLLTNVVLYITSINIGRQFRHVEAVGSIFPTRMQAWFVGLAAIFNLFFLISAGFITLINSRDRFSLDLYGFLLYLPIVFMVGWFIFLLYILSNYKK